MQAGQGGEPTGDVIPTWYWGRCDLRGLRPEIDRVRSMRVLLDGGTLHRMLESVMGKLDDAQIDILEDDLRPLREVNSYPFTSQSPEGEAYIHQFPEALEFAGTLAAAVRILRSIEDAVFREQLRRWDRVVDAAAQQATDPEAVGEDNSEAEEE